MIHIRKLTKTYGRATALDDVSFSAVPGRVTGFLGLNGSGKTTTLRILLGLTAWAKTPTLRILLGLTAATSGEALINGKPYRSLASPMRQVGAVLEQGLSHPGQTGRDHLVTQALLCGASRSRVDELLW